MSWWPLSDAESVGKGVAVHAVPKSAFAFPHVRDGRQVRNRASAASLLTATRGSAFDRSTYAAI